MDCTSYDRGKSSWDIYQKTTLQYINTGETVVFGYTVRRLN